MQQTQAIADLDALFSDDALDAMFGNSVHSGLDGGTTVTAMQLMQGCGAKRDGPLCEVAGQVDRCGSGHARSSCSFVSLVRFARQVGGLSQLVPGHD